MFLIHVMLLELVELLELFLTCVLLVELVELVLKFESNSVIGDV